MAIPDRLRIPLDESRFEALGRLPDGSQFMAFVTGAFPEGMKYYSGNDWRSRKQWLAVVHRFDAEGNHVATESRLGGSDAEGEKALDEADRQLEDMLSGLTAQGAPTFCDIWVKPFSVQIGEVIHGLFYEPPDGEDEETECVMLEPQDIMFHPPWDSGEYST